MYILLAVEVNYKDIQNKVLYIITNKENKKNIKIINICTHLISLRFRED